LLVWVEVKHGADLHEAQLENYDDDIRGETAGDWRLVLLAPRQSMPESALNHVATAEWQRVERTLRRLLRESGRVSHETWLMREFATYLKEEGLADEDALTPATVFAWAARPAAERTLRRLIELTQDKVQASRAEEFRTAGRTFSGEWWAAPRTELGPPNYAGAWLEWGFCTDAARVDARDAFVFYAGATFGGGSGAAVLAEAANQVWLHDLTGEGFERLRHGNHWRLWQFCYPEELMKQSTLNGQANELATWVLASFRRLETSEPPAASNGTAKESAAELPDDA
jgi:hypothetical protein